MVALTIVGIPLILIYILLLYKSKSTPNLVNIMSAISAFGVLIGTMALIVVLSVFNGFDNLVRSLFNSFNPDLQITLKEGKTFTPDEQKLTQLKQLDGVIDYAEVLEDKALLRYDEKQTIATVKGVSDNFRIVSGVDTMIRKGDFMLKNNKEFLAVIGQGIAYFLNVNLDVNFNYRPPISVYFPKRTKNVSFSANAINRRYISPIGIFSIEQDFDSKYILVPIEFARDLFGYSDEVTALEIKLADQANHSKAQKEIEQLFGDGFFVKNRYQQNALFYKTMHSEKWAIFLILLFILIVLSFNVIGSLTMLILEKRSDISILFSLGSDMSLVKRIFLTEGWMISIIGAFIGLCIGLVICWVQIEFEPIKLQGSGSFVIDAYPVNIQFNDILFIFLAVLIVGYFAAWYPIRYVTRRLAISGNSVIF